MNQELRDVVAMRLIGRRLEAHLNGPDDLRSIANDQDNAIAEEGCTLALQNAMDSLIGKGKMKLTDAPA